MLGGGQPLRELGEPVPDRLPGDLGRGILLGLPLEHGGDLLLVVLAELLELGASDARRGQVLDPACELEAQRVQAGLAVGGRRRELPDTFVERRDVRLEALHRLGPGATVDRPADLFADRGDCDVVARDRLQGRRELLADLIELDAAVGRLGRRELGEAAVELVQAAVERLERVRPRGRCGDGALDAVESGVEDGGLGVALAGGGVDELFDLLHRREPLGAAPELFDPAAALLQLVGELVEAQGDRHDAVGAGGAREIFLQPVGALANLPGQPLELAPPLVGRRRDLVDADGERGDGVAPFVRRRLCGVDLHGQRGDGTAPLLGGGRQLGHGMPEVLEIAAERFGLFPGGRGRQALAEAVDLADEAVQLLGAALLRRVARVQTCGQGIEGCARLGRAGGELVEACSQFVDRLAPLVVGRRQGFEGEANGVELAAERIGLVARRRAGELVVELSDAGLECLVQLLYLRCERFELVGVPGQGVETAAQVVEPVPERIGVVAARDRAQCAGEPLDALGERRDLVGVRRQCVEAGGELLQVAA